MALQDQIHCQITAPAATITICDPPSRNAMSHDMWHELSRLLAALADNPQVGVVFLEGKPAGSFISGANIRQMNSLPPDALAEYHRVAGVAMKALADFPKLLVAAIDGTCFGGGISLAACADLRLATESSRFCVPAARLGIAYNLESTRRVIALIGAGKTREMLLTARVYTAAEALDMGLVSRVGPDLTALKAVLIAGLAPLSMHAIGNMKRIIDLISLDDVPVAMAARVQSLVDDSLTSADHREGLAAFLAKRTPIFPGRAAS